MTSINATSYNPYYDNSYAGTVAAANAAKAGQTTTAPGTATAAGFDQATDIVLSDAAKAVLAGKDFTTISTDMRQTLDGLLSDAGLTSPYKDGALAIDLTTIDRRSLYAMASNGGDLFNAEEQKAAKSELARRFDAALAGPAAVARITGDLTDLYAAGAAHMDGASAEEKASLVWIAQRAALTEAQAAVKNDPGSLPNVANDPVANYLVRAETGEVDQPRPFDSVARDVRVVLDKQYADARAGGAANPKPDYGQFGSRSLAAIVLNQGALFSDAEIMSAKGEMRTRSSATLLACSTEAGKSGDPTALAKNIISAFASLSVEERAAAGWSEALYQTALSNYESSAKLAQMFGTSEASTGAKTLLSFL